MDLLNNFLSKLTIPTGNEEIVDDQILDEHFFAISVISLWFVGIAKYLVARRFPLNLSSREKNNIVRKSISLGLGEIFSDWDQIRS